MRALVTGSAGFVGRHMVAELLARGWDVAGCDLRDGSDCREIFRAGGTRYDLVVHCAYHVGGRAAIDGNPSLLAKNLELDAAMFDWAARTRPYAVLYFSSSAAYPIELQSNPRPHRVTSHGLREADIDLDRPRQPDAAYGWAKLTGERLAAAAAECDLRMHVVRPFSGYGSNQDPAEYPFPAIVRRILAGDLTVWGPPGQYRDWIHITDVVRGALAVVDADERRPVNLCSGEPVEFGDLACRIAAAAGRVGHVIYDVDKPTGVMYRVGNPDRMREHYTPTVTLNEGIRRAIEAVRCGAR